MIEKIEKFKIECPFCMYDLIYYLEFPMCRKLCSMCKETFIVKVLNHKTDSTLKIIELKKFTDYY